MNAKLIGIGAAGNKAAIEAIEQGVMDRKQVLLLNSTLQDVPAEYKDIATRFSSTQDTGGCGKEPQIAEDLMMSALQDGTVNLDGLLDPEDKCVFIVASSEGGSGCGAANVVAAYFNQVLGCHVHMFVFTGFEEDVRGLQNTLHYFQKLESDYTIEAISNKKFFNGNKLKAEREANSAFVKKLSVLLCKDLVESDQNLDETDQVKLIMTPGFMFVEYTELDKIKSVEQFNTVCTDLVNNSASLDFEPSAIRLGVILNISSKTKDYIDYSFKVLKEKLGFPYEVYTHIQSENSPEYMAVIAAGIKMPDEDITRIHKKYEEETSRINKAKDSFFSNAKKFATREEDRVFDLGTTARNFKNVSTTDKANFFKNRVSTSTTTTNSTDVKKQQFFNKEHKQSKISDTIIRDEDGSFRNV